MRIQNFSKFRDANSIEAQRKKIIIPSFTLSVPVWAGASALLAQFPIGNTDYYFSFKLPFTVFGSNFVPAIRWKLDDTCYRFVFWENSKAVLYYPVYAGERIGLSAVLEIWSINSSSAPVLTSNTTLYSSQIVFPEAITSPGCACENPDESITLTQQAASVLPPYAFCNPFCNNLCE